MWEASGSSYKYIYQYKDHLGNIRLSYDKTLAIKEESNFYPFGLKQEGYNTVKIGFENKYKYNGKELQDESIGGNQLNLYDYGARNYDSALGRWMNIDPLAEISRRNSPYTYALNNPVFFIDPDGMADASHRDRTPDKGLTPTPETPNFRNTLPERWAGDGSIDPSKKGQGTDTGNAQYVGKDGLPNGVDLPAVGLNEVVVKGYKSQSYYQGYFDTYKHIDGENPYSPYTPDGYTITVYGSIDYNFTTYSMSNSLVLDGNTNELAGFGTTGVGVSSTLGFSWNFGVSIEVLDKYDGDVKNSSNLFDRLLDYSRGGGATFRNWGVTHSQSAFYDSNANQFRNAPSGVISNGIQYNAVRGFGASFGVTKTNRLF
jgi:RHS repeat-associated protein